MIKIIAFLSFVLSTYLYGNYIIGNGQSVFFYDENFKSISYMRKSPFDLISVSRVSPLIELDGDEIIDLKNNLVDVRKIDNKNILRFTYRLNNENIYVDFFPSLVEKNIVHIISDLSNITQANNFNLIFHVVPQKDNQFARMDEETVFKSYDDIFFTTDNYSNNLYIVRNGTIESKITEKVTSSTQKYQFDNLYYIIENVGKSQRVNSAIIFGEPQNKKLQLSSILSKEKSIEDQYYSGKSERFIFESSFVSLKFFTENARVPDEISLNTSQEKFRTRSKLLYASAIYGDNENGKRLVEDINIRKDNIENVELFIHILKYISSRKYFVDENIINTYLVPQVLALCDSVTENGSVINGRDYSQDYYLYFKLFDMASMEPEFSDEREYVIRKRELVRNYLLKNYFVSSANEFKDRMSSNGSSYKNIEYFDVFSKEEVVRTLKNDYNKYYDKNTGLLRKPSEDYIDMDYNLKFLLKLYENNLYNEGSVLAQNINQKIVDNNYRIIPKIYLNKENSVGVYGELLYLYLMGIYIRGERNVH